MKNFGVPSITALLYPRYTMTPSEEKQARWADISGALELKKTMEADKKSDKKYFLVGGHRICLTAYCSVYQYHTSAIYRVMGQIKEGSRDPMAPMGRPKCPSESLFPSKLHATSEKQEIVMSWIENSWSTYNAENCPVGTDYHLVIDLHRSIDIYRDLEYDWPKMNLGARGVPCVSHSTFCLVFKKWMLKHRVRMREKKNVSSKCDGNSDTSMTKTQWLTDCDEIRAEKLKASTKKAKAAAWDLSAKHRERIAKLRGYVRAAEHEARNHPSNLCMLQVNFT